MYELPKFSFKDIVKILKNRIFLGIFSLAISLCLVAPLVGVIVFQYFPEQTMSFLENIKLPEISWQMPEEKTEEGGVYVSNISYEQAIIDTVKNSTPSVVSIVISKDLPIYEEKWVNPFGDGSLFDIQVPEYVQKGTEHKEVGSGSGFIISADGLVLTNKHVVLDKKADYTVLMNDGQKYSAKVLALDPVQDLAVIKIENTDNKIFQPLKLGDSAGIQAGQTVVAIGNALGEFRNTVSVGIVSGLGRTINASDKTGAISETLEDIIQTDAAINSGNSGGPLLNLKGEVIGINTAIAEGAQSIAFAIPINYAKRDINQVATISKIVYPFLGVRYILINEQIKKEYDLSVDYGVLVGRGNNGESAVTKDSAAEKAGIKEGDVILEFNGEKITTENTLAKIIQKYNAGDKANLKILREKEETNIEVTLGERTS